MMYKTNKSLSYRYICSINRVQISVDAWKIPAGVQEGQSPGVSLTPKNNDQKQKGVI